MSGNNSYDVLIIGGGVSGTALLYTLAKFTDVKRIALLEKYDNVGLVNSKATNNSQTLHSGDIETNYNLAKATKVKRKADMLKHFVEEFAADHGDQKLFHRYNKMILAVGAKEVATLEQRYQDFKELFPTLRRIERDEIAQLEPEVVMGRDINEPILALTSPEGYTIDYGLLSGCFVQQATAQEDKDIDIYLNTLVTDIKKTDTGYRVTTKSGEVFETTVLAVCAGGHTPLIAQSLGYGKNFSILSVAGSFFKSTRKILNGKVYTMQMEKLPFAAVHGDPDVHNADETRFGPTAKGIFMLERYNYNSIREYFKVFGFRWKAFQIIINLTLDRIIGPYLFKNFWYDVPRIGKRLFVKELKKIVPALSADDIVHGDGLGGTRPQILNLDTMQLEMGEAKISGDKVIFNITPSPGATTCLGNAYDDTQTIMGFFDGKFTFHKENFEKHFVK
ncbi:MAG: FAD-dependent oxidoreductase [Candidatus Absconditabacterales bacterium]